MQTHDTIHGIDVTPLSLLQRRLIERLSPKTSISVHALASRLRSTDKSVINQVSAIRQRLGAHVIITTPEGYRLGTKKEA